MFIGSFHHSIQAKGRLAIPALFRKNLGNKPIITQGLDDCLYLLPFKIWTKLISDIKVSPIARTTARNLTRLIAHHAAPVDFDPQGRVLIPQPLRNWGKLSKKVVIAGSIDWIEIWDHQQYQRHMKSLENQSSTLADKLTQD